MSIHYLPEGHTVASAFLLTIGFWWIASFLVLHFSRSNPSSSVRFKSFIPLPCCKRLPLPPIAFLGCGAIGTLTQLFMGSRLGDDGKHHLKFIWLNIYHENGELIIEKIQHMSFFLALIMHGTVDLLSLCVEYPRHLTQVMLSVALMVGSFMFYYHDIGHSLLEVYLHKFLSSSLLSSSIFSALRIYYPLNTFINGSVSLLLTLQGTWLLQISYIIQNPEVWDRDNPDNSLLVVCLFILHFLAILGAMLAIYTFANCCVRKMKKHKSKRHHHGAYSQVSTNEDTFSMKDFSAELT